MSAEQSFQNDSFLGDRELDSLDVRDDDVTGGGDRMTEPIEVIVSRLIFALLISVSMVMNLLLLLAVLRRRRTVQVIYMLITAMIVPDLIFYTKLVTELVTWNDQVPSWAENNLACRLWQFVTHLYPILYSALLIAVTYHAFLTLFIDYSGGYEESAKKFFPLILCLIILVLSLIVAPSGFFSISREEEMTSLSHYRQYCKLEVPALVTSWKQVTPDMKVESSAAFRLVYEIVIPFMLPLLLLAFPYIALLVGLMQNLPAASHSDHATKLTVVVTLWLITSYLMLHVATVLHNIFSIFSIWHRLVALFDAQDDTRVPKFQAYIHVISYMLTCAWGIVRPSLCFNYNTKLKKALGT